VVCLCLLSGEFIEITTSLLRESSACKQPLLSEVVAHLPSPPVSSWIRHWLSLLALSKGPFQVLPAGSARPGALIREGSTTSLNLHHRSCYPAITNTVFKHHPRHLHTWTSPDLKTRNQIDYILLCQKWRSSVKNVRTRPGADCNSDHQLAADIKFNLKKMKQPPPPIRFDYKTLDDNYRVRITNKFAYLLLCEEEWLADDLWNAGKEIINRIAAETIDKRTKKHTTWISDETFEEIKIRREIKSRRLDSPIGKALCRN